jgi:uncharacterized membrane protein YhiD involved in acid resistance
MINDQLQFQNFFQFSLSPEEALLNLVAALLSGLFIGILYRTTYSGISYSGNYLVSLIMLTMITALVIMVIGNNLARAFGLVGAMSIIRFRTAVKDTQDIMFIFFALAAGLAAGAGMHIISAVGTLFIGLVIYIASLLIESTPAKKEYLVQLVYKNAEEPEKELFRVLRRYCSKYKLVNIKSIGEPGENLKEYAYYVILKNQRRSGEFSNQLNALPYVQSINVFFDEG